MLSATVVVSAQRTRKPEKNPPVSAEGRIGDRALCQIESLAAEKEARTPAQQKIDSQLIYATKMKRGEAIAEGIDKLEVNVKVDAKGLALVDITAQVSSEVVDAITRLGGRVVSSFKRENAIRAYLPLEAVEEFAALDAVRFIQPADEPQLENYSPANATSDVPLGKATVVNPTGTGGDTGARPSDFDQRAARVREQMAKEMAKSVVAGLFKSDELPIFNIGAATSQGDGSHRAAEARAAFGVTGAGIKVGVLSDSYNALNAAAADVTNGDLPGVDNPNNYFTPVTVLQDAAGSDEGRAMLQIIHDLAPGAQLYYATAVGGPATFANNIRALRQAGCDIIIDDVSYPTFEQPFQDGVIAQAVNDVTIGPGALAGASYFSSAGNAGNLTDGSSGVWEGDFNDSDSTGGITTSGGVAVTGGTFHDFDPSAATTAIQNPVNRTNGGNTSASLFWSDPFGGSTNDYDLYLIENNGTTIVSASTNSQTGTQNPVENVTVPASSSTAPAGRRIAIFKKTAAAVRALHINLNRNQFDPVTNANIPAFVTSGQTKGHSAAAESFSTAATQANGAAFSSSNVSELFSSDGTRRIFLNPDGTPITPGCVLFACSGGVVRQKPDITAADGVATTLPANSGLNPFFGTSAAAPHAGAIAALLKSANPSQTAAQIRTALTSTAIDIETAGVYRTTGVGIVMAFQSLAAIGATPQAFLNTDSITTNALPLGGDQDPFIEPGEGGTIVARVTNTGGGTATNISATLTTTTPGVIITRGTSTFPDLAPNATARNSAAPFRFELDRNAQCGIKINFTLTESFNGSTANSPAVTNFAVQTGQPGTVSTPTDYTGAPVAIADADANQNPATTDIPFPVSGVSGNVSNLKFRFNGSACSAANGATTVGLDHTYVGDLVIQLISPSGTVVTLASSPGGASNAGNNFCNTVFDDAATASIQTVTAAQNPYTGSFRPAQPLSTFNGETANGTWTLRIIDIGGGDTGFVRAFSLDVTPFSCAAAPTAATASISGKVSARNRGVWRARVSLNSLRRW